MSDNFVCNIVFENGINDTNDLLLNMTQNNVVMFSLRLLFLVIILKDRVMLPNNAGNLKESIPQILGALFRRHTIFRLVFAGLIK